MNGAPKDELLYAASKGCLFCVRRLLEERKVNCGQGFQKQGYSVLDWSKWARKRGVEGADAVTRYICDEWLPAQCKRSMDEPAGCHGHGVGGPLRRAPPLPPPMPKPSSVPRTKRSPLPGRHSLRKESVQRPAVGAVPQRPAFGAVPRGVKRSLGACCESLRRNRVQRSAGGGVSSGVQIYK